MKEIIFSLSEPSMVLRVCNPNGPDYDPIDDGEIIQISFPTTLCEYLQPAGFLEIQLTIERAVTCEFIVSANTLEGCTDDPQRNTAIIKPNPTSESHYTNRNRTSPFIMSSELQ